MLLDASVNVISQEPRGFVPLSANTLSDDPDLTAINVRRLLSLLRRLALREGATYVFEPHDAAFRRTVQRGFETLLMRMFERGAFAGRTAPAAFQVTTSQSVNTAANVDQGRFVVELRVAPSLPMTFLTVRLVQSGDRTLVMEGR
jgi:phage tail sheath protein FI